MMKTKAEKIIALVALGGGGLFLFGFLMCCSGLQFPFFNAKSDLDYTLKTDFSITLPASAVVNQSYWVGLRDPEHVFKFQMAPADIEPFFKSIKTAAQSRGYEENTDSVIAHFTPLYKIPTWWNNPPLPDAIPLEYLIKDKEFHLLSHYRFLYSPTTGILYVDWGEF